jgi:mRNA-degrading endonuclease YafQ of YafQ-DinJ toxin-antitoxin module
MTEVAFSSSFKRAFKRRIKGNALLETRFWEKLEIFRNSPFDQSLRTHKLSGRLKDLWSFSIEYDLRVVFSFLEGHRALFVDIGTRGSVLSWADATPAAGSNLATISFPFTMLNVLGLDFDLVGSWLQG